MIKTLEPFSKFDKTSCLFDEKIQMKLKVTLLQVKSITLVRHFSKNISALSKT